jgi:PadR family transcriptional regulator PadR
MSKRKGKTDRESKHTGRTPPVESLRGTLDLLVLRTLAVEPMHGWGISQRIQQLSDDAITLNQGALYPALHGLEKRGLVTSSWGESENNRRAKFYRLTPKGERQLEIERAGWERFLGAVQRVLEDA